MASAVLVHRRLGERELAPMFREHGFTVRRGQQFGEIGSEGNSRRQEDDVPERDLNRCLNRCLPSPRPKLIAGQRMRLVAFANGIK